MVCPSSNRRFTLLPQRGHSVTVLAPPAWRLILNRWREASLAIRPFQTADRRNRSRHENTLLRIPVSMHLHAYDPRVSSLPAFPFLSPSFARAPSISPQDDQDEKSSR